MDIIGGIMMLGMGIGVAMDGYDAEQSSKELRIQIAAVQQKSIEWEDKYAEIMKADYVIEAGNVSIIKGILNQYNILANQIKVEKANYNVIFKKIQLWGIIFVTSIFFLLLLKQFGLLGPLKKVIMMPFKYLFNYIVHGDIHYGEKKS